MEGITLEEQKVEGLRKQGIEQGFNQTTETIPRLQSNRAGRNFNIGAGPSKKISQQKPKQKKKSSIGKQFNTRNIPDLFPSQEARDKVRKYEELRNQATANLNAVYDEIRPVIEQHERDNQDSVPISVGQKWIGAQCNKYRADVNFSFSIFKNFFYAAQNAAGAAAAGMRDQNAGAGGMRTQNTAAANGMRAQNAAAAGMPAQMAASAGRGSGLGMPVQNAASVAAGGSLGMPAQDAGVSGMPAQNFGAAMQASGSGHI